MSKKKYILIRLLITTGFHLSCVKINHLSHISQNFIRHAFHGKVNKLKFLPFIEKVNNPSKIIENFKANLDNSKTIISIKRYGYRAIIKKGKELHCIWQILKTEKKHFHIAIFFIRNKMWKIHSYKINDLPTDW